jgi:hypothetical protein
MTTRKHRAALQAIARNIAEHGCHIYVVVGEQRFAYTIGLTETIGAELVLAGTAGYSIEEAGEILDTLSGRLTSGPEDGRRVRVAGLGSFELRALRQVWIQGLLLGARDFYRGRVLRAFQVVPLSKARRADVPELSRAPSAAVNRAWRSHVASAPPLVKLRGRRTAKLESSPALCRRVGAEFVAAPPQSTLGVAKNVFGGKGILNGLRHPPDGGATGWFIWRGKKWSTAPDAFRPVHVSHLAELVPNVERYLGLAPGWRFLIVPEEDYEDVWFDEKLLKVR